MKRDGERCARRKERGRTDGWAVVTRWENPATPASATCQRRGPPGGRGEKRRRHGAHGHQSRPGVPLGRSPQGPAVESKRQEDKRSRKCDGRVQPRMERTLPPSQAMAGRRRDHTPRQGDGNSAPRPFPILWRLGITVTPPDIPRLQKQNTARAEPQTPHSLATISPRRAHVE